MKIDEVINCGGIAEKSPLTMQIYADVTGRPRKFRVRRKPVRWVRPLPGHGWGEPTGILPRPRKRAGTGLKPRIYRPDPKAHLVYRELYALYKTLHDAFGTRDWSGNLHSVMKQLIDVRNRVRR